MFERRLKILLGLIIGLAVVLAARAFQLQVVQKSAWEEQAAKAMRQETRTPTARGRILDRKGTPLAFDAACIDAAVDYRAIVMEPKWIARQAALRMPPKTDALPEGVTRKQLLADEVDRVKADVNAMWSTIATVCNKTPEEIEEIKQGIHDRVAVLQRTAWYRRYNHVAKSGAEPDDSGSWRKWLIGEAASDGDDKREASLDASSVEVGEQTQPHVIVEDITEEQQVSLQKALPHCPGLLLMESTHRKYDEKAALVASHVLGHLTPVSEEDRTKDPYVDKDEAKRYWPRDLIGRDGLERLAEPLLRGSKGQEERILGNAAPNVLSTPVPGQDVKTTIDIALQEAIDNDFEAKRTVIVDNKGNTEVIGKLHGAAVVIDVQSGEILAMVSHPTYDLNKFESQFRQLSIDEVNKPLLNRATQQALPPGSTAKTIIGSVAVTRGFLSPTDGIECTGFLKIPEARDPSKMRTFSHFRCWTGKLEPPVSHHAAPLPLIPLYGNPDGFLCLEDGIERSCNVFFETVAWRMKIGGVADAFDTFGLGRPVGIGIGEASGLIPRPDKIRATDIEATTFIGGIGQGDVAATPLQMANVAATLARDGVWVRPRLLSAEDTVVAREYHPLPKSAFQEDRRDLQLKPDGLAAIRRGMQRVATSRSGTGPSDNDSRGIHQYFADIDLAAKTGSAQIKDTVLRVNVRDANGNLVHAAEPAELPEKQRPLLKEEHAIGSYLWFHGTGANNESLAHAWFIGYAPASHPKIAFCVMVEYGGSGGRVCGPIARALLEACQKHGYLDPSKGPVAELLHEE